VIFGVLGMSNQPVPTWYHRFCMVLTLKITASPLTTTLWVIAEIHLEAQKLAGAVIWVTMVEVGWGAGKLRD
jgi:hypothetical protein